MDQKLLTDFRSELLDSRFGAKAISTIAESKRFPLHEMRDDVAFQIINDELYLDGNARQNLATFCQTWDDENVHKLMDLSINKNWIDKEEYPQSAAIDAFPAEVLRRTPLTRRRVCRCSVSVVAHYRELFRPDKRKFKIIF